MQKRPLFLLASLGASLSLHAIPMEGEGSQVNRWSNPSRTTTARGTDAHEITSSASSLESTSRGTTIEITGDDLEEDARSNIQMGLTADVALQVLQDRRVAEETYENALASRGMPRDLKAAALSLEESLSQEIKTQLKGQFLAELALETLQGAQAAADRLTAAYRTLPELKKTSTQIAMSVAEEALGAATRADLEARTVRGNASEGNFERETAAYKSAAEAWDKTLRAYADLRTSFQDSPAIIAALEDYLRNADVRATLWQAHFPWIKARGIEANIIGLVTIGKAEQAEAAWGEVVEAYGEALTKAERAGLKEVVSGLQADFESAQAREATWSDKLRSLKKLKA